MIYGDFVQTEKVKIREQKRFSFRTTKRTIASAKLKLLTLHPEAVEPWFIVKPDTVAILWSAK